MTRLEEITQLVDQTRARHEAEWEALGAMIRSELVEPVCKKHKLVFCGFFRRLGAKPPKSWMDHEPWYSRRQDLDRDGVPRSRRLSTSAKKALGPILDLLNKKVLTSDHIGEYVGDATPRRS